MNRIFPEPLRQFYLHMAERRFRRIHFDLDTVCRARRIFFRLGARMTKRELRAIRGVLRKGRFDGSKAEHDLFGILSRIRKRPRQKLIDEFGHEANTTTNDLEYWFFQVGGGYKANEDDFVATSIHWVTQMLEKRERAAAKTPSRQGSNVQNHKK